MIAPLTLTRLLSAGSRCEACKEDALIAARHSGQIRYYCREHVNLALRPLRLEQKRIG